MKSALDSGGVLASIGICMLDCSEKTRRRILGVLGGDMPESM
jgi:hypothetical protein